MSIHSLLQKNTRTVFINFTFCLDLLKVTEISLLSQS